MSATVTHISEGSLAQKAGIEKGDSIISVNDHPVRDVIDLMYYTADRSLRLKLKRGDKNINLKINNTKSNDIGIEVKSFRTKSCRNKCLFCFVDQLPKGMRKTLYLKDDDYRLSFLYGNYITLTNLSREDKKRIMEQRLSPLYVSVHTTNNDLRKKILGNAKAPNILKEILELTTHKIKIHVQIVICPGLNDGEELERTIKDLQKFYPYVASVAVVPVGLTRHRKKSVTAVEKKDALAIIESIKKMRKRFKRRLGDPIVYAADELYIKADLPIPALKEYGDLSQIENGVGLVSSFINCAKKIKLPKKINSKKYALITGTSFMPYLEDFAEKLKSINGLSLEVFKAENKFFGPSVTVTGLLTGRDVLKTVIGKTKADCLLVPDVMLKNGDNIFLDNVTLKDLEENLGISVKSIEATPEGLIKEISDGSKRED
jgi:putative radical SAM enzyme (TIGR03279 family)